jgi:hypothetical protein
MSIIRPPYTGDPVLDSWTNQITQALNMGLLPGVNASGAGIGGGTGSDGANGNITLFLYKRTANDTVPPAPSFVTYDYSNLDNVTITSNNGWTGTVPSDDASYLWVTFRYVSETEGTITSSNTWQTPVILSQDGSSALSVYITTDSGTVFKNAVGTPKTLTANVNLGGVTPTTTDYNGYDYDWTYEGNTICLTNDGSRTVLSTNGVPNTVNGSGVCAIGVPANSEDSAAITASLNTGVLRRIVLGPEDVTTQVRLAVSVKIGE